MTQSDHESNMGQDHLCKKFWKCHHLGPRYDIVTKNSVICYGPDSQSYSIGCSNFEPVIAWGVRHM